MARNRHGLSRSIRNVAKAKIRELCGFGCVICGGIPYDYDHFETEFHDCKEHDINDIVLLCTKHHREKKSLGVDVIKEFLSKNSVNDRDAFFDATILTEKFDIVWPSINIDSIQNNILIDGEEVLRISLTGNPRNPIHIDGVFYNDRGIKTVTVIQNEFKVHHQHLGDITCTNQRFIMKAKSGRPILVFRMEPKLLIIEELYFVKNHSFIIANDEKFIVGNGNHCCDFANASLTNNKMGIELNSGSKPLYYINNQIVLPVMSKMKGTISGGDIGISFW